jgi:hypothetical protein
MVAPAALVPVKTEVAALSPFARAAAFSSDPVIAHEWTPKSMRAALAEHEGGRFASSATLADAFSRDAYTAGVIRDRVGAALGLPYSTDFSQETTNRQRALQLAFSVNRWWFQAFPEGVLREVLFWKALVGFCLGVIEWQEVALPNERREWRPFRLHIVHPSRVEYLSDSIGDDQPGWYVYTSGGERRRVIPGDGEWFLHTSGGPRPWMQGAVRSIAQEWLSATITGRDWNRRLEVEGIGIRKAVVPATADPAHVRQFADRVSALGRETTIVTPRKSKDDGYDVEIDATDIQASHSFKARIDHSQVNIAIAGLGQNLTTKVDGGGSYAAADVHKRVKIDLLKGDVAALSTDCREQIVKPWGRVNHADWRDELAPWNRWDATPPEDMQPKAQTYLTVSQSLKTLREEGIDTDPVIEVFGLTRNAEPVSLAAPADQPPAGAAPPSPNDSENEKP